MSVSFPLFGALSEADIENDGVIPTLRKLDDTFDSLDARVKWITQVLLGEHKSDGAPVTRATTTVVPEGPTKEQLAELARLAEVARQEENKQADKEGRIRVYVRISDIRGDKDDKAADPVVTATNDTFVTLVIRQPRAGGVEDATFVFPKTGKGFSGVFPPDATDAGQQAVFGAVKDRVKSFVNGLNVALLAYGQSGTGKTYTMNGVPGRAGIVPRIYDELFGKLTDGMALSVSYVDVRYNDLSTPFMYDLIQRKEIDGVSDERTVSVSNAAQAQNVVANAERPKVEPTLLNNTSSRSHAVLRFHLVTTRPDGTKAASVFNLVDLAGSESVESGATKAAQATGQGIRNTLNALQTTFTEIARQTRLAPGKLVVSSRDPLVQIIKDCLQRDGKVLTVFTVSATRERVKESKATLLFAQTVLQARIVPV